jgi:uncharacterized membrane protein YdjX (TVP38/TMEM64 family)
MSSVWKDIAKLILPLLALWIIVSVNRDAILPFLQAVGEGADEGWAVPAALTMMVIGSLVLIPQWMLIAAVVAAFGLGEGAAISWLGSLLGISLHLIIGRTSAASLVDKLAQRLSDDRFEKLRQGFVRNSFQSGFIIRLVPTGPALIVNMLAGSLRVRAGAFLAGSALGIVPKIALTGLITQGLLSTAQGQQYGLWITVCAIALLVGFFLIRTLKQGGVRGSGEANEK